MHSRFSSAGPSLLGVGHGQLIAWQVTVVLAAAAIIEHGPERWALSGVALALLVLTALRWRHRWAYQWLLTVWQLRRGQAARPQVRGPYWPGLPAIAVGPARIRGGGEGKHETRGRRDETDARDNQAAPPGESPPDVHRQFGRVGTGDERRCPDQIDKHLRLEPPQSPHDRVLHHRDVRRRPAKRRRPQPEEQPRDRAEARRDDRRGRLWRW